MSEYEYDTGATRLVISEGLNIRDDKKLAIVSAEHLEGANIAVAVQAEDAPAIALAVLESAGFSDDLGSDSPPELVSAMRLLGQHKLKVAREAEREAEDAKVRAFRDAIMPHAPVAWEDLHEGAVEEHRDRYRAARKFFEES